MKSLNPITFAIPDLQTGCEIVARLPLANPNQAAFDLCRLLDNLLAKPPDVDVYFRLLEHSRLVTIYVADELAKRYLNKALPLGDLEEGLFQLVVSIWLKMSKAYTYCAQRSTTEGFPAISDAQLALMMQRSIHYAGMALIEHQRARREYPAGLWAEIHDRYVQAETCGIATLAVPDIHETRGHRTHCVSTYVGILLCDMAECYGLPIREQMLLRRWAVYWAHLVSLHHVEPEETPPYFVIDLTYDAPLRSTADCTEATGLRRLDTSRLAAHIGQVRRKLRKKIPPSQLALGGDCTTGQCRRLLRHLFRYWSQARAERKFRRRATSGVARLCTGFDEMHYFISGKPFEQPENVQTYSRREFETLFAFRHLDNPRHLPRMRHEQMRYRPDDWDVVNQSANGFQLTRSISGRKMSHGQLLALCPHDGDRFLLVKTCWLMQEKRGGLIAGVEVLPGMPVGIAARVLEPTDGPPGKYQPAFLLPANPAVGEEQSLVLPCGFFRIDRVVELFTDRTWQVKLTQVFDDGPDFERVGYVVC